MERFSTVRCVCLAALAFALLADAGCTTTRTILTTVTAPTTSSIRSTVSTPTVFIYSSTVLIGTPARPANPTFTFPDPLNPVNCAYYTGTDIPSPPPSSANIDARDPTPARCTTVKTTVTVEYLCIETDFVYPSAATVSKTGVLTTHVPESCTARPKRTKHGAGNTPPGDLVFPLFYPYYPQTIVECCVQCAEQYNDLVASAFIVEVQGCECLVNNGTVYPGRSKLCPRGIQPYGFQKQDGVGLPGPCRVKP